MQIARAFLIIILLVMVGCATNRTSFYWGKYSETLYQLKKEPGQQSVQQHKKELMRILKRSKELKLPPPPGVQAELGYMMFEEGKQKVAMDLIQREQKAYPESKVLMKKIYRQMKGDKK